MDNLARYNNSAVVDHYANASGLMPPERYLFSRYVRPGMEILDIGVGGGRTTPYLAAGAARYLGIDYAEAMVSACRKRFPETEFAVGDASNLVDLENHSFDLTIFSFNGIDTLPDDASRVRALSEMRRVTRPHGRVIVSSHNAKQLVLLPSFEQAGLTKAAWRIVRAIGKSASIAARNLRRAAYWNGEGYIRAPFLSGLHMHVSTPESVAADCAEAGLKIVEAVGAFHPRRVPQWANNWTTYVLEPIEA